MPVADATRPKPVGASPSGRATKWQNASARRSWWIASGITLAVIAWFVTPASLLGTVELGLVYGIGAIALNMVTGVSGMPSIGNAAFLAIGGYAVVLIPAARNEFYLGLLCATVASALVGALVGLSALRLRGLYLAVATLALQFIVADGGTLWEQHTGNLGGYSVPNPTVLPGVVLTTVKSWYIVLMVALGLVALLASNLLRSRWGRSWLAIRENDLAASIMGVNVQRQKVAVFAISSAMVGFAGGLLAYYTLNVEAGAYTLTLAIQFIAMVILGGLGSMPGALLGTGVIVAIPYVLQQIGGSNSLGTGWWTTNSLYVESGVFGLIILLTLVYEPEGLAHLARAGVRRARRRLHV